MLDRGTRQASRHRARRRRAPDAAGVHDSEAGDPRSNCMCVWPHTTRSASTPAKDGATPPRGFPRGRCPCRSAGWRGRTAHDRRPRPRAPAAPAARGGTRFAPRMLFAHPADDVRRRESLLARVELAVGVAADPTDAFAEPPQPLERLGGNGPAATSPPTRITASSGTSASTASSAGRLPCTS